LWVRRTLGRSAVLSVFSALYKIAIGAQHLKFLAVRLLYFAQNVDVVRRSGSPERDFFADTAAKHMIELKGSFVGEPAADARMPQRIEDLLARSLIPRFDSFWG
jgi:hypothetical protein